MQKTLSVSPDIYKQRFGGIVKLCSSLKSTDYWTFRVFNEEEDDLLDTVRDFSSAMYDNFHHLAPEIIEAFGSLCENEDIGFIYSALVTQLSRHIVNAHQMSPSIQRLINDFNRFTQMIFRQDDISRQSDRKSMEGSNTDKVSRSICDDRLTTLLTSFSR
jgi:hypothetical protein